MLTNNTTGRVSCVLEQGLSGRPAGAAASACEPGLERSYTLRFPWGLGCHGTSNRAPYSYYSTVTYYH